MAAMKRLVPPPQYPVRKNGFKWARKYNMKFRTLVTRDGMSLILGVMSVASWSVAEIPQIFSNYNQKSTEGLSLTFLCAWIIGDLLNVFGCLLEPSTLPTQLYMAISYTFTSSILASQSVYYSYFYKESNKQNDEVISMEANEGTRKENYGLYKKDSPKVGFLASVSASSPTPTPTPLPEQEVSTGGELYCRSARYLSMSHTPSAGSYMRQKMTPENDSNSTTVPLLHRDVPPILSPSPGIKPMLCLVFYLTFFLGIFNFRESDRTGVMKLFQAPMSDGKKVARKLLQAHEFSVINTSSMDSGGIGSFLGWGMTIIYLGSRLPQIYLNIRRGNVEGLNPLMFLLALLGNITYMASILLKSTDWSQLRPNLPWLVEAGGCVLLDTFIVIQCIYFSFRVPQTGATSGAARAILIS